jgi:hypothetical protein
MKPLQLDPARSPWISIAVLLVALASCWFWMKPQQADLAWDRIQSQVGVFEINKLNKRLFTARQLLTSADVPPAKIERILNAIPQYSEEQAKLIVDWHCYIYLNRKFGKTPEDMDRRAALNEYFSKTPPPAQQSLLTRNTILALFIIGGIAAAYIMTMPSDLRQFRWLQMALMPVCLVAVHYLVVPTAQPNNTTPDDLIDFIEFLPFLFTLAVVLGPNIASYCAHVVTGIMDPQNWKPIDEELLIAPIQKLIYEERYSEALRQIEKLLATRRATHESLLLKAKLLHHFKRDQETRETLLKTLRAAHTIQQQSNIMLALREIAGPLPQ